jgi:uncharacterized protein YecE (DUF72 family)
VFLYFDNTDKLKAPINARELRERLDQKTENDIDINELKDKSDSRIDSRQHKNKTRTYKK